MLIAENIYEWIMEANRAIALSAYYELKKCLILPLLTLRNLV